MSNHIDIALKGLFLEWKVVLIKTVDGIIIYVRLEVKRSGCNKQPCLASLFMPHNTLTAKVLGTHRCVGCNKHCTEICVPGCIKSQRVTDLT